MGDEGWRADLCLRTSYSGVSASACSRPPTTAVSSAVYFSEFFFTFKALSFPSDSPFFNFILSSVGRYSFNISFFGLLRLISFDPLFNFFLCKTTWLCDVVVKWTYGNGDRGSTFASAFDPAGQKARI